MYCCKGAKSNQTFQSEIPKFEPPYTSNPLIFYAKLGTNNYVCNISRCAKLVKIRSRGTFLRLHEVQGVCDFLYVSFPIRSFFFLWSPYNKTTEPIVTHDGKN